ncbi:hypothetical protein D3C78_1427020 [compost metagenome]
MQHDFRSYVGGRAGALINTQQHRAVTVVESLTAQLGVFAQQKAIPGNYAQLSVPLLGQFDTHCAFHCGIEFAGVHAGLSYPLVELAYVLVAVGQQQNLLPIGAAGGDLQGVGQQSLAGGIVTTDAEQAAALHHL